MSGLAKRSVLKLPADPAEVLTELLELRSLGLCAPLPMATETSHAYACARREGSTVAQAHAKAVAAWTSTGGAGYRKSGENDDRRSCGCTARMRRFRRCGINPVPDGQRGMLPSPAGLGSWRCGCGRRCCAANTSWAPNDGV